MEVGGGYFLCKRNLKTELDSGKVSLICILNKPLPVLGAVNHKHVQGIWECLIQCFIKYVAIVLKVLSTLFSPSCIGFACYFFSIVR